MTNEPVRWNGDRPTGVAPLLGNNGITQLQLPRITLYQKDLSSLLEDNVAMSLIQE